ncbi:GntR family transcriptional regulator [Pigmentiphaga sp. D-2]|uniref:GntR family transcriptional regulator n=1 Tax=Pigmentiphaga sp. D-2 TaxID=1002116 RepID=UPI00104668B9|nr:FCD domain-containing protein [Pigmentiphaga sp. D-2]
MIDASATHLAPATGKSGATRSMQISDHIRGQILRGRLQPGFRLRLEDLRTEFDVSWSPLRESLSKLVAEGLIVSEGSRAYYVAPVSRAELQHLLEIRVAIETRALATAIDLGDDEWERELVATHHQLRKLESMRWQPEQLETWEHWHERFHRALVAGCQSALLQQYCGNLHDLSNRYRRLFLASYSRDRDIGDEHENILKAALDRDAAQACRLLEAHIRRTLETILEAMPTP